MRSCCPRRDLRDRAGFTLLEALATLVVLLLVFAVLVKFLDSIEQAWRQGASDPFAEAQSAFETVAQSLSSATLESYQDYADISGAFRGPAGTAFVPDHLARRSDLAFVCGSRLLAGSGRVTAASSVFFTVPGGQTQTQSQAGMNRLFNASGYFVEFGDDDTAPAFFDGTARRRWRLKEIAQPSESLQVFASTTSGPWISQLAGSGTKPPVLAENVIALVILPERNANDNGAALAPNFNYDSRDSANALTFAQLPPRVRIALVAIDEPSAQVLAARNGTAPPALVAPTLFQQAAKWDADLAALDASLTAAGIHHRTFQRDIVVTASAWTDAP